MTRRIKIGPGGGDFAFTQRLGQGGFVSGGGGGGKQFRAKPMKIKESDSPKTKALKEKLNKAMAELNKSVPLKTSLTEKEFKAKMGSIKVKKKK